MPIETLSRQSSGKVKRGVVQTFADLPARLQSVVDGIEQAKQIIGFRFNQITARSFDAGFEKLLHLVDHRKHQNNIMPSRRAAKTAHIQNKDGFFLTETSVNLFGNFSLSVWKTYHFS